MNQNEHVITVTTMEYQSKLDGQRRLGQVIQLGILRADVSESELHRYSSLPTGHQATYRDDAMAIEHGDLGLELREEDIPLVIPHFGPDPVKGFKVPLRLSDESLRPWPDSFPLFFRELVHGTEAVMQWFRDRGGIYPHIYTLLTDTLAPVV